MNRVAVAALILALCSATPACAQEKVTRLIVAFPAGGPVDLVARTIAEQLGKETGQKVIVDGKPGGNGAIAPQNVSCRRRSRRMADAPETRESDDERRCPRRVRALSMAGRSRCRARMPRGRTRDRSADVEGARPRRRMRLCNACGR